MKLTVKPVTEDGERAALLRIRREVFEQELGISMDAGAAGGKASLDLLASVGVEEEPVATLSVVETTSNAALHAKCGLRFEKGARVARYTQMAVLKPWRGLDVPLRMMLEGHRLFVAPNDFDYTWLLFDAVRAASSKIATLFRFSPGKASFFSEYGLSRPLVRNERSRQAARGISDVEDYLDGMRWMQPEAGPANGRAGAGAPPQLLVSSGFASRDAGVSSPF